MEVEKLFKISIEYISDYLRVLFTTIRSPQLEFQPIELPIENTITTQNPDSKVVQAHLNPKLLSFLLISIFIGSVLNTNIPKRNPAPDFVVTLIMVIGYWLLFSSLAYLICRIFAGRESLIQTLSVNLQVLAVIHVLSSFLTFLWGVIITGLGAGKTLIYLQGLIGKTLINEPINVYFVVQFVLVLIYLPLANKRVHRFSFSRLRRKLSNRALAMALSHAETTLFYLVFLVLSATIVQFSKTNYYIHSVPLTQPEISNFLMESMEFNSAMFSPDGKFIVTFSNDGTKRVWNVETGKVQKVDPSNVSPIAFSPDGRAIAYISART